MPHNNMAFIFGVAFLYSIIAITMGVRMFWRSIATPMGALKEPAALWEASKDVILPHPGGPP
jgi:hypothetical protein